MRANRSDENATDASVLKCRDDRDKKQVTNNSEETKSHIASKSIALVRCKKRRTVRLWPCDCSNEQYNEHNKMFLKKKCVIATRWWAIVCMSLKRVRWLRSECFTAIKRCSLCCQIAILFSNYWLFSCCSVHCGWKRTLIKLLLFELVGYGPCWFEHGYRRPLTFPVDFCLGGCMICLTFFI